MAATKKRASAPVRRKSDPKSTTKRQVAPTTTKAKTTSTQPAPATTGPKGSRPKHAPLPSPVEEHGTNEEGASLGKLGPVGSTAEHVDVRYVLLSLIVASSAPVRRQEDEAQIEQLTQSFRQAAPGPEFAMTVHPLENGRFEIISGHHRRTAAERAGLTAFWVLVRHGLSLEERLVEGLRANMGLQNSALDFGRTAQAILGSSPEEGAYKRLADKLGVKPQTLSERLAANRVYERSYGDDPTMMEYWDTHVTILAKISRKPEKHWAALMDKCLRGKMTEAAADKLLADIEADKPRSKKTTMKAPKGGETASQDSSLPSPPSTSSSDAQATSSIDQELKTAGEEVNEGPPAQAHDHEGPAEKLAPVEQHDRSEVEMRVDASQPFTPLTLPAPGDSEQEVQESKLPLSLHDDLEPLVRIVRQDLIAICRLVDTNYKQVMAVLHQADSLDEGEVGAVVDLLVALKAEKAA